MGEPDDALLARARAGDDDALGALLERHAGALRRSVAGRIPRRLRHLLSEEDVLQQTYTDAFLDLARFRPVGDGAFGAWLRALARANLTDAVRALEAEKRGEARRVHPGGLEQSLSGLFDALAAESRTTPSRGAARGEAAERVRAAVARLPEDWRRVVELYDLEGRGVEETAAALGRSPGATWLLRNRAHRRLRELVGLASDDVSTA